MVEGGPGLSGCWLPELKLVRRLFCFAHLNGSVDKSTRDKVDSCYESDKDCAEKRNNRCFLIRLIAFRRDINGSFFVGLHENQAHSYLRSVVCSKKY